MCRKGSNKVFKIQKHVNYNYNNFLVILKFKLKYKAYD